MSLLGKHGQCSAAGMGPSIHLCVGKMSYRIVLPMQLRQAPSARPWQNSQLCTIRGTFLCDLVSKVFFSPQVATTDACMERPTPEFGPRLPLSVSNVGTQVKGKQTPSASDEGNEVSANDRDVDHLAHIKDTDDVNGR